MDDFKLKDFFYRLTIWTAVLMTDEMKLIDVTGKAHSISKRSTRLILVAGWIFFVVSSIFHCIFYKIHPSATDISLWAIKWRLLRPEMEDNEEGFPMLPPT